MPKGEPEQSVAEGLQSEKAQEALAEVQAAADARREIPTENPTKEDTETRRNAKRKRDSELGAVLANSTGGKIPRATPEDLATVSNAATKMAAEAESAGGPDHLVAQDTPSSMQGETGDNANARLRPFMEWAADRYSDFVESRLPSDKLAEYKRLQDAMEEAAKGQDAGKFKTAREAMEKFVDDNFGDIKDAMRERSDNPPDPKRWEAFITFLKLAGIFGVLGGIAWFFSKNNGCWKVEGGAMSEQINVFDFSQNPQYCSCGPDSATVTNLDACGDVHKKDPPDPWFVTCPEWCYPACTVMDDDGNLNADGIYYMYYITSPIGEWNNIVNQGAKLAKGGGKGLLAIAQWGILIGSLLMAMFLAFQGVQKKSGAISYYVMAGVLIIVGILGYWYIGTQINPKKSKK